MAVELKILSEKWKFLLAGLIFQYIHGLAARGVHYLHRPGPILQDLGFMILLELGMERGYISETVFTVIFFSFLLGVAKYGYASMSFGNVVDQFHDNGHFILSFIIVNASIQFYFGSGCWHSWLLLSLRIITFYSTQLPGPNYHCREGSKLATLPHPDGIWEVLLINFPRGVIYGCGDLIFSSHMIFTLVFVRTYHKYGSKSFFKTLAWLMAIIQSLLIIASRKHYLVDVVAAWYTVNLVVSFIDNKLPEAKNPYEREACRKWEPCSFRNNGEWYMMLLFAFKFL